MSKAKIGTLIEDIQKKVLDPSVIPSIKEEDLADLGVNMAKRVVSALQRNRGPRSPKTIYASEIGKPCIRQTWYNYHRPELAEKLRPSNVLKFLYGDILEEILLFLARTAGHEVTGEQERVEIPLGHSGWKITGRLDAVIDGEVVDAKSTSPYGFEEMSKNAKFDDKFGYKAQVSTYVFGRHMHASVSGTPTPEKDPYLFMVDKQNGNLALTKIPYEPILVKATEIVRALEDPSTPPRRFYEDETFTNGNRKLCTACSYCPFKAECWPGVRAFAYARGPVFLTKVEKEPKDIIEIKLNRETTE